MWYVTELKSELRQALDPCSQLLHYTAQGDVKVVQIYSKIKNHQINQGIGGDAESNPKS